MMNKSSVVEIDHLTVRRGRADVLHDVSLRFAAGRVTGLLGPSGAGKSTLIRALIGVQSGVSGSIHILGHSAGSRALSRKVSYMSQSAAIYDDLTVRQNVAYFGATLGLSDADVVDAIAAVDLSDFSSALVSSLSGGQRNRVALAIALLGNPQVVVLDEPTVGLDPVLRRDLWRIFRRVAEAGAAVLVSSHVMDEAARCDDLVLMRDGRVLAHDTLGALYAATGAADPEGVFLSLVETAAGAVDAQADSAPRPGPGSAGEAASAPPPHHRHRAERTPTPTGSDTKDER